MQISPLSISCNLKRRLAIVLLPEPVLPIIAVVSPLLHENDIFLRTGSSPPL